MTYKHGDVVTYLNAQGIALVDSQFVDEEGRSVVGVFAWRDTHQEGWILSESGQLDVSEIKPHLTPNKIWAEFVAWRLTHGNG